MLELADQVLVVLLPAPLLLRGLHPGLQQMVLGRSALADERLPEAGHLALQLLQRLVFDLPQLRHSRSTLSL